MLYSCAMNTNEISPKANFRMNRLQKIGAFLRTTFFIAALLFWILGIIFIVTGILNPRNLSETYRFLFFAYAVECVLGYKLFSFYARGDLFAVKAVRYIRWIGIITVLIGIWSIFDKFARLLGTDYFVGASSAKGILESSLCRARLRGISTCSRPSLAPRSSIYR